MAHAAVKLERPEFKFCHLLCVLQPSFVKLLREQILVKCWQTLGSKYVRLVSRSIVVPKQLEMKQWTCLCSNNIAMAPEI